MQKISSLVSSLRSCFYHKELESLILRLNLLTVEVPLCSMLTRVALPTKYTGFAFHWKIKYSFDIFFKASLSQISKPWKEGGSRNG